MVYRLVTGNTIDQRIVERAAAKRKLEKMVIHKGMHLHTWSLLNGLGERNISVKKSDVGSFITHSKQA